MIAAIYARVSREQDDKVEGTESESVKRQKDFARAFAQRRGWTVDERFVFVDDGISGAEFERRPQLSRMMRCLKPRPPFSVLVVSEQKSLGREMSETAHVIKQLARAGVEIFEYVHGKSLTPKNWMDKMISAFQSGADEAHQAATRERVYEAHTRSVMMGHCVGGRVFGYRNKKIQIGEDVHGQPVYSHVERRINEAEAATVRYIFSLYDSGLGLKAIAKRLTSEHVAAPVPFKRKDGLTPTGWSPSTIAAILARELYNGVIVWDRTRKRNDWGEVDQQPKPSSEWKRVSAKHLRIVDPEVWKRVAARRADTEGRTLRFESGRISGRPPKDKTVNLLAGLATCGMCGGGLVVETSSRKDGRVAEYVCHRHRHNGTCANALRIPVADMNEAVLVSIEEHALTPEAIEQVIRLSERDELCERKAELERDQQTVAKKIANLVSAMEQGGEVGSVLARVRELEAKQRDLAGEIARLQPVPRLPARMVEDRLSEWRRLLRQSVTQGRAVLQRVLQGRIVFRPVADAEGYEFEAPTRFDKLFTGLVVPSAVWAKPAGVGTEQIGREDTVPGHEHDVDYGDLLEKAHGKGVASPTGTPDVWTCRLDVLVPRKAA